MTNAADVISTPILVVRSAFDQLAGFHSFQEGGDGVGIAGDQFGDLPLKRWRDRYDAAVAAGKLHEFNAAFHGLWRYYLMYCEGGFRGGAIDVAQVTMVKA